MRLQSDEEIIIGRYKLGLGILCVEYKSKTGKARRFIIGQHVPDKIATLLRLCFNLGYVDHSGQLKVRK